MSATAFLPPVAAPTGLAGASLCVKGRGALLAAPEQCHPALWRAHQLDHQRSSAVVPSGHAVLDAELPGGGWPHAALTELLLPAAGVGELRLLALSLRQVQQQGRCVLLVAPPLAVCGPGWRQMGLSLAPLLVVQPPAAGAGDTPRGEQDNDRLWALEQALKSGCVGAVLAWLPPRVGAKTLRRLQLAAQSHDGPAFLLREAAAARRPSPAVLRLVLQPAGVDRLSLHLLKRRGPALVAPLPLALPPVLPALDGQPLASPPADAPQTVQVPSGPPGPAPLPAWLQALVGGDALPAAEGR